jgi:hypothetical protein
MSWRFSAVGKPVAVAKKAVAEFPRMECPPPENEIKNEIGRIIRSALEPYPSEFAVRVEAFGSQSGTDRMIVTNVMLKIESLGVFIE